MIDLPDLLIIEGVVTGLRFVKLPNAAVHPAIAPEFTTSGIGVPWGWPRPIGLEGVPRPEDIPPGGAMAALAFMGRLLVDSKGVLFDEESWAALAAFAAWCLATKSNPHFLAAAVADTAFAASDCFFVPSTGVFVNDVPLKRSASSCASTSRFDSFEGCVIVSEVIEGSYEFSAASGELSADAKVPRRREDLKSEAEGEPTGDSAGEEFWERE
jgi:hypothetical protein